MHDKKFTLLMVFVISKCVIVWETRFLSQNFIIFHVDLIVVGRGDICSASLTRFYFLYM